MLPSISLPPNLLQEIGVIINRQSLNFTSYIFSLEKHAFTMTSRKSFGNHYVWKPLPKTIIIVLFILTGSPNFQNVELREHQSTAKLASYTITYI